MWTEGATTTWEVAGFRLFVEWDQTSGNWGYCKAFPLPRGVWRARGGTSAQARRPFNGYRLLVLEV